MVVFAPTYMVALILVLAVTLKVNSTKGIHALKCSIMPRQSRCHVRVNAVAVIDMKARKTLPRASDQAVHKRVAITV